MPLQSRAAQGFAGVAVEIDLILKGIKTFFFLLFHRETFLPQLWK